MPALISIGDQAAALARDWQHWSTHSAAAQMRLSRANAARCTGLFETLISILATRPHLWWACSDLVEPLAARGMTRTATQIGKCLSTAAAAGQVRKRVRDDRRVTYGAPQREAAA
ncbi:hypothetical protein [Aromatoleum aromaticum]|uniref:hypothetical protein n=1 Tax=Aromatoleum aromaticum TaxID=551760 RepID=UPI0012FF36A0|nr:hypothetical protein [Aromatoleum aromaticum]